LNRKRNLLVGIIALVLATAVVSFAASTFIFYTFNGFSPKYEIPFDASKVSLNNVKKFSQVRNILESTYYKKIDENDMLEGAISGMTASLKDPYTVYFTKEQMKMFEEKTQGNYVGIGVSVTMGSDGILTVLEPFPGSPAKAAGILKGDKIVKVDGKDVTSVRDENMIVSMIKGEENTKVKLTIYRQSEDKTIDVDVTRKKIKIENLSSEMLPGNIGYIKIVMFDNDIAKYFTDNLNKLKSQGMKGLIIDLRDDPGGDYSQVVKIADTILPKGLIVYTEDKNKHKIEEQSDARALNMPLAILVNGNSASASEILSGAVKDHKVGTLIGTKTFGKGLVQSVRSFEDGSGIKVTIARYFTPSGVCIQGIGIQPNEEVKLPEKYKDYPVSQVPREEDTQLKRAIEVVKYQISNGIK
jgi:carboxyl-terminal processing protease